MCTGKCSRIIAITLYPMVLLSIICNIVLFFPDLNIKYVKEQHITEEVKYMGGVIGGGLLVLMSALSIHLTGKHGCCANRLGVSKSGGRYISAPQVVGGVQRAKECGTVQHRAVSYSAHSQLPAGVAPCHADNQRPHWHRVWNLTDNNLWGLCTEPKNIVQFNIGLFGTLLATSCLQAILCAIQMINGLFGCLCGTCNKELL